MHHYPSVVSSCADIAYWFAFFFVFSQVEQFSFSFQQLALKNVAAAVLQLFFPLTQDKGKKSQLYSAAMPDGNNSLRVACFDRSLLRTGTTLLNKSVGTEKGSIVKEKGASRSPYEHRQTLSHRSNP